MFIIPILVLLERLVGIILKQCGAIRRNLVVLRSGAIVAELYSLATMILQVRGNWKRPNAMIQQFHYRPDRSALLGFQRYLILVIISCISFCTAFITQHFLRKKVAVDNHTDVPRIKFLSKDPRFNVFCIVMIFILRKRE